MPATSPLMMAATDSGSLLEQITIVVPAAVAIRAAVSFVTIPPVPHCVPAVVVSATSLVMSSTTWMGRAVGSILGLAVYKASTSVIRNKRSASTSVATSADRVSLSPKRSSWTATVSCFCWVVYRFVVCVGLCWFVLVAPRSSSFFSSSPPLLLLFSSTPALSSLIPHPLHSRSR